MENTKLELELSYVGNVSQLLSKQALNDMEWNHGKIAVTANDLWLPTSNGWSMIPLKFIELVGRLLTSSVASHIQEATGYSKMLTVDYKKRSIFGNAYITSTIVFAGRERDIYKLKNHLLSVLGFKFDATFGELSPEESRLMCLLAVGLNDINVLLPIFDCNKILLNHAFLILEKRGLVDCYAAPTHLGLEYVNQIKVDGMGKLGSDVRESFEDVARTWEHVNIPRKPARGRNKIMYKHEDFTLVGRVPTEHVWQCIPIHHIEGMDIEETSVATLSLNIKTKYGTSIYVEPTDKSILYALHGMLDRDEDLNCRVLNSVYLGMKKCDVIAYVVGIKQSNLENLLCQMKESEWIDPENNMLSKGMDVIRDFIQKKSIIMEDEIAENDLERMEEFKMNEAKRRLIHKMEDIRKSTAFTEFSNVSSFGGGM